MTEALWNELETLAATLDRLQRELRRCQGSSKYRDQLETEIAWVVRRRQEILAELQKPS